MERFIDEVLPQFEDYQKDDALELFYDLVIDTGLKLNFTTQAKEPSSVFLDKAFFHLAWAKILYRQDQKGFASVMDSGPIPVDYFGDVTNDIPFRENPCLGELYIWRTQFFEVLKNMGALEPYPWVDRPDNTTSTPSERTVYSTDHNPLSFLCPSVNRWSIDGLFSINGKRLIPVRAIHIVTHWFIDITYVPRILANRFADPSPLFLRSFEMADDKIIVELSPKFWEKLIDDFDEIQEGLQSIEAYPGEKRPIWEVETVKRLPASAFVWEDDLHQLCLQQNKFRTLSDEPGWQYAGRLNLYIEQEIRDFCLEGFNNIIEEHSQHNDNDESLEIDESVDMRESDLLAGIVHEEDRSKSGKRNALINVLYDRVRPKLKGLNEASAKIGAMLEGTAKSAGVKDWGGLADNTIKKIITKEKKEKHGDLKRKN